SGTTDIYRISSEGGTPMQVSADIYTNEYFGAPSPDGRTIAFTGHGFGLAQWWRKGHSHIDESEIWLLHLGANPAYEQFSEGGAKEVWPMWDKDGRRIYYVSDRSGAQNIWTRDLNGQARQVTQFKDGRVLWPSISYDGRKIVFERNFQIWQLDPNNGQAAAVSIGRRGASAGPAVEHLRLTDQISEIALAPDGKKIAFVVRGEVFAAAATDGGDAARVTFTVAEESQIASVADRLFKNVFVAPAAGGEGRAISFLANGGSNTVSWSPDGTFLLFDSGQRTETAQLARIDLIPRTPKFREDQFRDLFKEETPKT